MELCVALDRESLEENISLVKELKDFDIWLKIGFRSYIRDGVDILKRVKDINPNFKVFLDLKLYDIPNTMADAGEEISNLGVDMFNIHASAGERAMSEVMNRLKNREKRPLVLAVTALTSFSDKEFKDIYNSPILLKGVDFAESGFRAGVDGVVSSIFESRAIKQRTSNQFLTLTPGIRPFGESADDQQRVGTIELAKHELVDFAVIGRPIYRAENPKEVVQRVLAEISK
jgi:orotidine-5'-phosphate decarboxylase